MLFSSMTFIWAFLPILLAVYFLIKEKYRNVLLVIFSILFYSWGEPKYVLLMILSILINYALGLIIDKIKLKRNKKIILIFALLINFGLLVYFKYFNFITENINKIFNMTIIPTRSIVLPIGISFYTFQIVSYIIDVYREKINVQKNVLNLALYISFFPQLIAGPIVKYHDINEQLKNRTITIDKFKDGIRRFVLGLAKKVILANSLAVIADKVFEANIANISTPVAWVGAICYMLQIYFDFSGYSDMAIGLGKMFGFEFMENFNIPYISQSITEFWRRWHISLSTWFKEYLYIPLGGNRKGKLRTYINLSIVFLATGIWHGAAWNFLIWGIFHGVFIVIERVKLKELLDKNKFKIINHLYTLIIVLIGWVLFRANGIKHAVQYIKTMCIPTDAVSTTKINLENILTSKSIMIIILAILFSGVLQVLFFKLKKKDKVITIYKNSIEPFVIAFLFIICVMALTSNTYNPFIYFRF